MKFIVELGVAFTGLALLVASAFTVLALIGYFQGANEADVMGTLKVTVPIVLISLVIAWKRRDVFSALFTWMLPL
jgi:hypothetical protein